MNIIELLPKAIREEFLQAEVIEQSFISNSGKEYFKDRLLLTSKGSIYIFMANKHKTKKIILHEFLLALLNLLYSEYATNKVFILYEEEFLPASDFFKLMPVDSESFAPDFEYILSDINNNNDDLELKRNIKIKLFSELMKFILKDDELYEMAKSLITNN